MGNPVISPSAIDALINAVDYLEDALTQIDDPSLVDEITTMANKIDSWLVETEAGK